MVVNILLARAKKFVKERYALGRLPTWMAVTRAIVAGLQAALMVLTIGMYIWLSFTDHVPIVSTAFLILPNLWVTALMLNLAVGWDRLPSIPEIAHGTIAAFIGWCCSILFMIYFGGVAVKSTDVFSNALVTLVEEDAYVPLLIMWINGFIFVFLQMWNLIFFPTHLIIFFFPPLTAGTGETVGFLAKWFSPLTLFSNV